jgi:hypothetical protein
MSNGFIGDRHTGERISGLFLNRAGIHVGQFPYVAVGILKSVPVHETVILRLVVSRSSSSDRFANQIVDFASTVARQADQDLGALSRVADFFWREGFEFLLSQQHYKNVFADDHASGGFVSELGIEREAEFGKEIDRLIEILYRQIHKNLPSHFYSPDWF